MPGCPIRISTDQVVCADPRSFSQLITSFFASESLGIPHTPLFCLLCSTFNPLRLKCALYYFHIHPLKQAPIQYIILLFKFVSQYVNELLIFRSCGEYRSRTDDLLRARQAL